MLLARTTDAEQAAGQWKMPAWAARLIGREPELAALTRLVAGPQAPQGGEDTLISLGHDLFRGAEDDPDRIAFDMLVNGQAQRMTISGGEYFQVFTP